MERKIQSVFGNTGYRHQLDRARRFLNRVADLNNADWGSAKEVEFQDMMWAFFQNCWHVKDWLDNDPLVPKEKKETAILLAHQSTDLKICRELCNGVKHLGYKPGASHQYIEMNIAPGWGVTEFDCVVNDGAGNSISGKQLARRCIAEWIRILESQQLSVAQLS